MERSSGKKEIQKIDVEKIINSKNPAFKKAIPRFVINYLKKIIHQDELNEFLEKYGHLRDAQLIEAGLRHFEIKFKVSGTENIPLTGRHIFVSNHPLGGLDGLVFIYEISRIYSDIKFPVNDILVNIENLRGIFLPVNKLGSQGKEIVRGIEEAYASNTQILYFPAGLCSRKRRGIIRDLQWQKSFITKARQHKRDIIPAYFSGRNSNFFYKLANIRKFFGIKMNIEMIFLADEMFKQKDKEISLVFGKPISWETFDNSRSAPEWAEWVKSISYELSGEVL
jgi:putative hemolysin